MNKDINNVIKSDLGTIWVVDWNELKDCCVVVSLKDGISEEDARRLEENILWSKPAKLKNTTVLVLPHEPLVAINLFDEVKLAIWQAIANALGEAKKELYVDQESLTHTFLSKMRGSIQRKKEKAEKKVEVKSPKKVVKKTARKK